MNIGKAALNTTIGVGVLLLAGTGIETSTPLPSAALVAFDPETRTYATFECITQKTIDPAFSKSNIFNALDDANQRPIGDLRGKFDADPACIKADGFIIPKGSATMAMLHYLFSLLNT